MSPHQSPKEPKIQKRIAAWPRIIERVYGARQDGTATKVYAIDVMLRGERIRETFATGEEAEKRAKELRAQRAAEGATGFTLKTEQRVEAEQCIEELEEHGATLTEATRYYIDHVLRYRNAPPVSEIVKRLVEETTRGERRGRTIQDLRARLNKFAERFGTRQLAGIALGELRTWLDNPDWSARSRINYATKVSQLYNYAVREGWADTNLADRITRPKTEDGEPELFSVDEAGNLLTHANEHGLLPLVAIGLFAGLRVSEIQRLDWSAVKPDERAIIVGAEVAKKRSRRVVEINDTLAAWLPLCANRSGPVLPLSEKELPERRTELVKAAGLKRWAENGLRHTFASYHLARHGDPTKTAFQMGNSPVMVHNHYKGLVSNGDVAKYWSLRPRADG